MVFDLDTTLVFDMAHAQAAFAAAASTVAPDDPTPLATAAVEAARDIWRASDHVLLGKRLGIASWEVLWADFDRCHPSLEPLRAWAPEFRRGVWERALLTAGHQDHDPDDVSRAFVEAQRRPHPLVPGGLEALEAVAATGRTVGLLTNGPPDIQRHKLAGLGCEHLLAAVCISGEMGVGKPDRQAFSRTLEACGASPASAVMVGDSWNRDVEGASRYGMAAVWLSFGRALPDTAIPGVTVVAESTRLAEALGC